MKKCLEVGSRLQFIHKLCVATLEFYGVSRFFIQLPGVRGEMVIAKKLFEMLQTEGGAKKAPRNQFIEALRIVAAYGIVAYHSGARFNDMAYSGLIVFLILAPMADVSFNWTRIRSTGHLARALMVPWGFWWIIYGIYNIAKHKVFVSTADPLTGVLYGTSAHLWFLPYIFMVLVLLNALKKRVSPYVMFWVFTVASVTLLATVTAWRTPSLTWVLPMPQWIHALPAVCIGVVLGLSARIGRVAIVSGVVIAVALIVAIAAQLPGIGIPYAVGSVLTAFAVAPFSTRHVMRWSVQPVADCMLGVFLTHILWLKIFSRIGGEGTYLTVTLTFFVALMTVFVARRISRASRLILG